jgi:hypothetical protein
LSVFTSLFFGFQFAFTSVGHSSPFRHLSFFSGFQFPWPSVKHLAISVFPGFFLGVHLLHRVLCSKILVCFLGFNFLLQVSDTWHVFSIPFTDTCLFFWISISFYKCRTLRIVFHPRSDTCLFFWISISLTKCQTLGVFWFSPAFFLGVHFLTRSFSFHTHIKTLVKENWNSENRQVFFEDSVLKINTKKKSGEN